MNINYFRKDIQNMPDVCGRGLAVAIPRPSQTRPMIVGCMLVIALAVAGNSQPARAEIGDVSGAEQATSSPSFADRAVSSAQELVMHAIGLIGIRYAFGGGSPAIGFDCSGLVRYVFNHVTGRSLPHNSFEMSQLGSRIDRSELQAGDLVFFNTRGARFSHVGIYVGEGRFIHSPSPGGRVHIVNMRERYWTARFNGARRLVT